MPTLERLRRSSWQGTPEKCFRFLDGRAMGRPFPVFPTSPTFYSYFHPTYQSLYHSLPISSGHPIALHLSHLPIPITAISYHLFWTVLLYQQHLRILLDFPGIYLGLSSGNATYDIGKCIIAHSLAGPGQIILCDVDKQVRQIVPLYYNAQNALQLFNKLIGHLWSIGRLGQVKRLLESYQGALGAQIGQADFFIYF